MDTVDFTMGRLGSVMNRCPPTEVLFNKGGRLLKDAPLLAQNGEFSPGVEKIGLAGGPNGSLRLGVYYVPHVAKHFKLLVRRPTITGVSSPGAQRSPKEQG